MASFAEMIYGTAESVAKDQGAGMSDAIKDSVKTSAELALKREELAMAKQKLQGDRAAAQNAGRNQFIDYIFKVQGIKDPTARKNYMKHAPNVRNAYGVPEDEFSDEAIASLGSSDEDAGRAYTLSMDVQNPNSPLFGKPDVALRIFNDPTQRINIPVTPAELRAGGEDFGIADAAKNYLTYKGQEAQREQSAAQFREGQATKKQESFEAKKEKLSKEIEAMQLVDLDSNMSKLETLIPGLVKTNADGKLAGVTDIAANIPTNLLSDKDSEVRQLALNIFNTKLKKMSGSAVTSSELPRIAEAMGMKLGPLSGGGMLAIFTGNPSSEQFVRGMRQLKNALDKDKQKLRQAYTDEVYNEVTRGVLSDGAPTPAPPAARTIDVGGGIAMSEEAAKAYLKNTKYPKGARAQQIRKALGGN
jgi:hypothetical protein